MRMHITADRISPVTLASAAGGTNQVSPSGAIVVNSETVSGYVDGNNGSVKVAGQAAGSVTLHTNLQVDEHNHPALLKRSSDGKIIAHYCRHAFDNNYYQRISTNADSIAAWDAETNIGSTNMTNMGVYTYAEMVEVSDGIFSFMRAQVDGTGPQTPCMIKSVDNGATWTALDGTANQGTKLLSVTNQRPYMQMCKGGANRIDFITTDGNGADASSVCHTYHFYYDGADNTFKKSDGTSLTLPITPGTHLTGVSALYTATKSYCWDIAYDGTNLACVWNAYIDPQYHNDFWYGYWNGASWDTNLICNSGGFLYTDTSQPSSFYSNAGLCLDPDNANIAYCCIETGTDGPHQNGGWFQIWKAKTYDHGVTWDLRQLTHDKTDKYRLMKPSGKDELVYFQGTYPDYTTFSGNKLMKLALGGN